MNELQNETAPAYTVDDDHIGRAHIEAALRYLNNKLDKNRKLFETASDAAEFACLKIGDKDVEHFCVAFLDNMHRLIEWETIATGTLGNTPIYPRELLKRVLFHNAAAVILFHNHPSGDCEPSDGDIDTTRKIVKGLDLFEVRTLDHIIVSGGEWYSMGKNGYLNDSKEMAAEIVAALITGSPRARR